MGYYMEGEFPTVVSGGNNGNGMWGQDGIWAILLLALLGFGRGYGGYGFGGGSGVAENYVLSTDFANIERAEIICNIHGHNHNCGYSKISSTTMSGSTDVEPWLWRFCVPNICANRYNTGYSNFEDNEVAPKARHVPYS